MHNYGHTSIWLYAHDLRQLHIRRSGQSYLLSFVYLYPFPNHRIIAPYGLLPPVGCLKCNILSLDRPPPHIHIHPNQAYYRMASGSRFPFLHRWQIGAGEDISKLHEGSSKNQVRNLQDPNKFCYTRVDRNIFRGYPSHDYSKQ